MIKQFLLSLHNYLIKQLGNYLKEVMFDMINICTHNCSFFGNEKNFNSGLVRDVLWHVRDAQDLQAMF